MSIDNVQDITPRVQYTATVGQTIFPYPFQIFQDADIVVDIDGGVLTITTDYTVSGEGDDNGGNVTLVVAATGGEIVTLYRDIAIERDTDFQRNGPFRSQSINDDLDKLTLIAQQLERDITRCLRVPQNDGADLADLEIPDEASRANKYLAFDASGEPVVSAGTGSGSGWIEDIATGNTAAPITVDTVADMKALTGLADGATIIRQGYYAAGDHEPITLRFIADVTPPTEDNVVVFHDDAGAGYFILDNPAKIADLQAGVKHDGTDSTIQMRALLAATKNWVITGPVTISVDNTVGANATSSLAPSDDSIGEFTKEASLTIEGQTTSTGYAGFFISGKSNITLVNPYIIGDKYTHSVTTGENGIGIQLVNSSNIKIIDPRCEKHHADGIYIGSGNSNIEIIRPICDDNRRQGISLISCDGLLIDHPILTNTRSDNIGTTPLSAGPHAGIDIEPNSTTDVLKGIRIINPKTAGNQGFGVLIQLREIADGRTDATTVDIVIENHEDDASTGGMRISGAGVLGVGGRVDGFIHVNSPIWKNNELAGFTQSTYNAALPHIIIDSPQVIEYGTASSSSKYASPYTIYNESGSPDVGAIGNITIRNPSVSNPSGGGSSRLVFVQNEHTASGCTNVNIEDPVSVKDVSKTTTFDGAGTFTDKFGQMQLAINANTTMSATQVAKVISTPTATCTINLPNSTVGAPELEFTLLASGFSYRLDTVAIACNIKYNGTATYTRMTSTDQYAYIKLKKVSATLFLVTDIVGTWTPS